MRIRRWWWLAVLAVVAAVVRTLQARGALLYPDGYEYLLMAKGIAGGGRPIVTLGSGGDTWLPSADASLKPLFPALVALLHVAGLSLAIAARAITAAASAAVCVLVGALAARLSRSAVAGLAAGALTVASPTLGHWAAFSGPDPLAQALALGAALSFLTRRPVLAGALAGLCVATRPEYALLALPVVFLSLEFAAAACAAVAAVLLAVRPPLAVNHAVASVGSGTPSGFTGLVHSDWPLLALALIGLVLAPRRHALVLAVAASALSVEYLLKNPGSTRYFAALVPLAAIAVGYTVVRARTLPVGLAITGVAVALTIALPRPPTPPPDAFKEVAAQLFGDAPLYTAAPDAYGVLVSRPLRVLRPGVRGLILVDAAKRTYAPAIHVRGRILRRIPVTAGFVRPDGTIDDRPTVVVLGAAFGPAAVSQAAASARAAPSVAPGWRAAG